MVRFVSMLELIVFLFSINLHKLNLKDIIKTGNKVWLIPINRRTKQNYLWYIHKTAEVYCEVEKNDQMRKLILLLLIVGCYLPEFSYSQQLPIMFIVTTVPATGYYVKK